MYAIVLCACVCVTISSIMVLILCTNFYPFDSRFCQRLFAAENCLVKKIHSKKQVRRIRVTPGNIEALIHQNQYIKLGIIIRTSVMLLV